jgi:glycosyltransferase involved in cell wall biosynthesis
MSKEEPLVSVVMNCHNGERFLKEAIDSVYAQSYQNWEIIFWDNGSTDNSALIAKSYDERLKYFLSKETTSLGKARNMAIKKTNGKYITFLDCDDLHLPEKIAIQLEIMKTNTTVLTYGSWIEINETGSEIKKHKIKSQNINVFEQLLYKYNLNFTTLMIDKNFIENSNIFFDSNLSFSPDFNFVMRIAYSNNISSIGNYLAQYRVHSDSMSHKYQEDKYNEVEYTMKILSDLGAKYKYLNFNLLSLAILYRMKYKDSKKSGKYFFAFINLIHYFVLRLRIAFVK